jgi:formate hydrogenlyase subunit 3/multisubunit Na+/H+ antiporter MnhD subunit
MADVTLPSLSGFGKGIFESAGATPQNRLVEIISNVVAVLTIFGGLAFLFWFVVGALTWASSGGNAQQLDKAKGQMGTAVVGLFVLVLATAFTWLVGKVTGLDIINLELLINKVVP